MTLRPLFSLNSLKATSKDLVNLAALRLDSDSALSSRVPVTIDARTIHPATKDFAVFTGCSCIAPTSSYPMLETAVYFHQGSFSKLQASFCPLTPAAQGHKGKASKNSSCPMGGAA